MGLTAQDRDWIARLRSHPLPRTPASLDADHTSGAAMPPSVYLSRLFTRPAMHQELQRLDAQDLRLLGLTPLAVLTELMRIAFADPAQLYDAQGQLIRTVRDLPENIRRSLASLELSSVDGVETVKFRFINKLRALEVLAKHLGLLQEKLAIEALITGQVTHSWEEVLTEAQDKATALRAQLTLLPGGQLGGDA